MEEVGNQGTEGCLDTCNKVPAKLNSVKNLETTLSSGGKLVVAPGEAGYTMDGRSSTKVQSSRTPHSHTTGTESS